MKLLKEITEESLGLPSTGEILGRTFKVRKSARGIILNERDEVSLQHVTKKEFYKLPGGGVDAGETIEEALRREIREEVGCEITIEKELGVIIEYRTRIDLLHISYGFVGRIDGQEGTPIYEEGEIADGMKPVWVPLKDSIKLLKNTQVDMERDDAALIKFMIERELTFLEEAVK